MYRIRYRMDKHKLVCSQAHIHLNHRKEKLQIQKWAGMPQEKSPNDSKKERLVPRSSFQVHEIAITGKSKYWDLQDVNVATRFNKVFMSYAFEKQEMLRSDINFLQLQNKYVNEFLATLAHELRNPLAPISSGLTLLEDEQDPDLRKEYMETMSKQIDHMTTMINDLMDVSRITQNKVKLSKEIVDLRTILHDAIDASQSLIIKNKHQLVVNLPDEPVWIFGDSTRLNQVFVNILTNAAKYTEKGGRIEMNAFVKDLLAHVSIKDNGLGIETEELDAIFTMFTQMNTLSSQSKSGLGIGLTLVKRLLEMHDAEIHVYSAGLGYGSEFEVLIPITDKPEEEVKNRAEKTAETDEIDTGVAKILLVDDNEDLTKMLKIILEKKNYQVIVATDGKSALDMFSKLKPDFAIIDLGLPDMTGFELCERLKELENSDKTVYFSHSGLGNKEEVEKSLRTGFKEHFVKPVKINELVQAMNVYAPKR